jgi:hypothetical protein
MTVVSEGLTGNVPATVENRGGPGGEGGARGGGDRGLPAGPGVRILAEKDNHAANRAAEPSEQVMLAP